MGTERDIIFDEEVDLDSRIKAGYPKGKNYCLLIAIDEYEHIDSLANPVSDVKVFRDILRQKYNGCEEWVIKELFDEQATQGGIEDVLAELKKTITSRYAAHNQNKADKEKRPLDNLLIFIAGHGYKKAAESSVYQTFLLPHDAEPTDNRVRNTLRWDNLISDFFAYFEEQCFHFLLIVDTCYGGALQQLVDNLSTPDRTAAANAAPSYDPYAYDLPSSWLITSGRTEPVPDGMPGEHSPFAQSLINYLKNSNQAVVNIILLMNGIQKEIIKKIEQHKQLQLPPPPLPQHHKFGKNDQGGQFCLLMSDFGRATPSERSLRDAFYQINFENQRWPFMESIKLPDHRFGLVVLEGKKRDGLEILSQSLLWHQVYKVTGEKKLRTPFVPWPVSFKITDPGLASPWQVLLDKLQHGLAPDLAQTPIAELPAPQAIQLKKQLIAGLLEKLKEQPVVLIIDLDEEAVLPGMESTFYTFWRDELLPQLRDSDFASNRDEYCNFWVFILNKSALTFDPAAFEPEPWPGENQSPACQKVVVLSPVERLSSRYKLNSWKSNHRDNVLHPGFEDLKFDDFTDEDLYISTAVFRICEQLKCPALVASLLDFKMPIV